MLNRPGDGWLLVYFNYRAGFVHNHTRPPKTTTATIKLTNNNDRPTTDWVNPRTLKWINFNPSVHYNDVTMDSIASQITSLAIVCSAVYSGAHQRKHQSSASLAFVHGIHPHKWPVTRKMFPFDDVIMFISNHMPSKVWDEITFPFQTSTVAPLKFEYRSVISSHIL